MSNNPPKIYTEKEYMQSNAWGLYSAIDVYDCNREKLSDGETIKKFNTELCDRLGVKRYGDVLMYLFGDDPKIHGWSTAQMIETSLVSGHFIQHPRIAYVDIFSCKYYNAQIIIDFIIPFFEGKKYNFVSALRVRDGIFSPQNKS
ncbi:MAG: S-adenosylmethionine decarboxylase SpeH [Candidatus Peregrinibacteria bacterium Greene1014_49]|nr:MAG: S-adenosylmethionine decarboxylase SpeH [Candidatus Peregrinibacteria bacterium Greene1014_49]